MATYTIDKFEYNGNVYVLQDGGALQLTGGQVTGPVTFGDSVSIDDLTAGDLVVTGSASFTNGVSGIALSQLSGITSTTATLAANSWSSNAQTVTVSGVTATNTVVVSPAPASFAEYSTSVVYCSAQGANSLTFTCTTIPTNALTVNVLILNI